jgi:hypothetical protein
MKVDFVSELKVYLTVCLKKWNRPFYKPEASDEGICFYECESTVHNESLVIINHYHQFATTHNKHSMVGVCSSCTQKSKFLTQSLFLPVKDGMQKIPLRQSKID